MIAFMLMIAFVVAILIQGVRVYILGIKEPTHEELWGQLEKTEWFIDITKNERYKEYIYHSKTTDLLQDSYYISKLLKCELTRQGFIKYMKNITS